MVYITKDKTTIIKGFAILFMIAHHILIKEFYIKPDSMLYTFPALRLQIGMKTCVGIFTFIIGYGFYFNKKYDIGYVYSHVKRLLLRYWFILLPTILIAYAGGGYYANNKVIIENFFGISHQYNLGNWYIYFYIYAILILPVIAKTFNKRPFIKLLFFIILCGLLTYANINNNRYVSAIRECTRYTPLLAIGYVCAKTNILSALSTRIHKRTMWIVIAISASLFRCCISSAYGIVTDVVTVPVFIISVAGIFQGIEDKWYTRLLIRFGSVSTMMWFIHALPFSDATRSMFQPTPYWTNNLFILFIVVTLVSYLLSVLLEFIFSSFKKLSNTVC